MPGTCLHTRTRKDDSDNERAGTGRISRLKALRAEGAVGEEEYSGMLKRTLREVLCVLCVRVRA